MGRKENMKDISLLDLLKSGAHFGHTTSRWNPKMKPFIFTTRNNIHILDLEKTKKALVKAAKFAHDLSAKGGVLLFVGTKRQGKEILKKAAIAAGGRENGAPGPRPHYHQEYYGAFVLDPDGHNIEAVCREPA